MKISVLFSVIFLAGGLDRAFGELTTIDGKPVAGKVLSVIRKDVILLENGRQVPIKLARLSTESQAEAIREAKSQKTWDPYPAMNIQVQVATKRRPQSGSWYMKTMSIEPKVVITGVSSMEPIPAAEAVMLIVVMDTRAKYTNGREKYSVKSTEKLPIPAALNGARRQFDFKSSEVAYDSYRDNTNIGGFVYKFFVFALREPETGRIVNFQTNNARLQGAGQTNPDIFTQILGLSQSADFPAQFE